VLDLSLESLNARLCALVILARRALGILMALQQHKLSEIGVEWQQLGVQGIKTLP